MSTASQKKKAAVVSAAERVTKMAAGKPKKISKKKEDVFMEISCKQLLFDPNQPRKKFTPQGIKSLAQSIKTEGLQQPIIVTFAYFKNGLPHYFIKAGERRVRAHKLLGMEMVECLLRTNEKYNGEENVKRILAQAAENSSRVPQTHAEIVAVVQKVVAEQEIASRGLRGYIKIAINRVASAFGFSDVWAANYYTLSNLHPVLLQQLDEDDPMKEKLNFNVGLSLARAPQEEQHRLYEEAKPLFKKNFHAGLKHITGQTRSIREAKGEKVRGRQYDDMQRLISLFNKMGAPYDGAFAHMKKPERERHLKDLFSKMSVLQCDGVLFALRILLEKIQGIHEIGETQRHMNYNHMKKQA